MVDSRKDTYLLAKFGETYDQFCVVVLFEKYKHFLCFYSYRNTRGSIKETRNSVGTTARSASFSTQFIVSPKLPQVFL
jgi:hypothetical protein